MTLRIGNVINEQEGNILSEFRFVINRLPNISKSSLNTSLGEA